MLNPPARWPASRRRKLALALLAIAALTLLVWCGALARFGLGAWSDWQALQSDLSAVSGSKIDLSSLRSHVASMRTDLESLRSTAGPLLSIAPGLGWLPRIGGEVKSAPALLDMAIELLDGGDGALKVLAPLWPPQAGEGRSALERIARSLASAPADLDEVRAHIDRAGQIRRQIDASVLGDSARKLLDRFDSVYPAARASAALLSIAPQLLGVDHPRTYLVLVQNEDELRPTGGFISAAGRVTIDAGRIVTMTVVDSYAVDDFNKPYGDPPAPLLDIMGSELWLFRDSNWSPDFPESARKAAELYTEAQGGTIDGVIALNQRVVQAIVAAFGPIQVDPDQPPLNPEDIRAYMRSAWAPPAKADVTQWVAQRKDFIDRLAHVLLDRALNASDSIDWPAMGRALYGVLRSRDLLIYLSAASEAAALSGAGWDGAVRSVDGDYLMVVDANLGFNKANAVVRQALVYSVTLRADGSSVADLTVTYTHTGPAGAACVHAVPSYGLDQTYEQLIDRCYWNYRRVLVPAGAQLVDATRLPLRADQLLKRRGTDGSTAVSAEYGKTVFSTMLLVERGRRLETRLRYTLPDGVVRSVGDRREYRLLIQRQSGAGEWPVTVTVNWPPAYRLIDARPEPASATDGSAVFTSTLSADDEVGLVIGPKP